MTPNSLCHGFVNIIFVQTGCISSPFFIFYFKTSPCQVTKFPKLDSNLRILLLQPPTVFRHTQFVNSSMHKNEVQLASEVSLSILTFMCFYSIFLPSDLESPECLDSQNGRERIKEWWWQMWGHGFDSRFSVQKKSNCEPQARREGTKFPLLAPSPLIMCRPWHRSTLHSTSSGLSLPYLTWKDVSWLNE